jgi:flavin-dependent dehydrogenase
MTDPDNNYGVVILGGGPAGTSAALTLLKYSKHRVAVIENTDYSKMRVGETASPSLLPLLRYLGVEEKFLNDEHLESYGIDASWGSSQLSSRNFLFTGQGNGWHLDRRKFDKMMADMVEEMEGTLLTFATIIDQNQDKEKKWHIKVARNGKKIELKANFVIDASGKKAIFSRKLGSKWQIYDRLIGVVGFYNIEKSENLQQITLIESVPYGWWYSARLPHNIRVVAFMTDSDIARNIKISDNWMMLLKKTRHIKKTVDDGKLISSLKIYPAHSQIIQKVNHTSWIPTGDAVASFDPLSSLGIGHAMTSGIHAAKVAHDKITSDGSLLMKYFEDIVQNFRQYLKRRNLYYQYEQRWTDYPFWNRRIESN